MSWRIRVLALGFAAGLLPACHTAAVSARRTPSPTMGAGATATAPSTASSPAPSPAPSPSRSVEAPPPSPSPNSDPFALARSLRYPTPEALATALANAETTIRSGGASAAQLVNLGEAEDAAYHQLDEQPDWRSTVLAQLPERLRPIAQANLDASDQLNALNQPRDTLPAWRILAPAPEADLKADYLAAQTASGIPWQYLAAINLVESRMGRIRGLSSGGAEGPMQFIPATWAYYGKGGDVNNPHDAILGAGRFLADHGGPADMARALYAYNPSSHYVQAITIYAQQIEADPRALDGYYNWQVYYGTLTRGDALLTVGYGS